MLYAESWEFNYERDETKRYGERLQISVGYAPDLLETCNGLAIREQEGNSGQLHKAIIDNLHNNRPVLIYLDAYWTIWGNRYLTGHFPHFTLIVGYNESNHNFYCVDPIFSEQIQELPVDHFIRGNNGKLLSISRPHIDFTPTANWDTALRTFNHIIDNTKLPEFEQFIQDITASFDFKREMEGYEEYWETPFYKNFNQGMFGRKSCADAIEFISSYVPVVEPVARLARQIAYEWAILRNVIQKLSLVIDDTLFELYNHRLLDKLKLVFALERDFVHMIKLVLKHGCVPSYENTAPAMKWNPHNATASLEHTTFVDLSCHFNNKGLKISAACTANFDGTGDYIAERETPLDKLYKASHFKFPEAGPGCNDNIICMGQSIDVPAGEYACIMIAATSEWGDSIEKLTVKYEHKNSDFDIEISDWIVINPRFNHQILWKGSNKLAEPVNLYMQEIPIYEEKMYAVTLPYNPNLHIFSLSLVKKS
ncbi:hypothetical protein YSY43_46320 [Paenibacillus sp. YSY-4.3]